ncbi:MAG TPA: cytochrome c [Sphingomicrobium sp.]
MKILRNILLGLGALVLLAVLSVYLWSSHILGARPTPVSSKLAVPSAAQLADGPRQLHVLGCLSCHGEGLKGDEFLNEPGVATIYAPNLTLVAAKATDAQLDHAIRQGIGHDGRSLLVMPSEGYQFMTDGEVAAIIAAIRALPKGGKEYPLPSVGPKGRIGLILGKFHTAPNLVRTFRDNQAPDFGAQFAAGRHIVATNCAECHGPQLRGQEVEPGAVAPDMQIAGAYDLDQFRTMLRTGVAPGKKDIGLMGRVAKSDFKYLTDEEIAEIHAYLSERARRMP